MINYDRHNYDIYIWTINNNNTVTNNMFRYEYQHLYLDILYHDVYNLFMGGIGEKRLIKNDGE